MFHLPSYKKIKETKENVVVDSLFLSVVPTSYVLDNLYFILFSAHGPTTTFYLSIHLNKCLGPTLYIFFRYCLFRVVFFLNIRSYIYTHTQIHYYCAHFPHSYSMSEFCLSFYLIK